MVDMSKDAKFDDFFGKTSKLRFSTFFCELWPEMSFLEVAFLAKKGKGVFCSKMGLVGRKIEEKVFFGKFNKF